MAHEDLDDLSDEELERIANGEDIAAEKSEKESPLDFLLNKAGLSKGALIRASEATRETALGGPSIVRSISREAADTGNQQSLVNALQMKPAPESAGILGQTVNIGYRHGLPLAASLAFPPSIAAGPTASALSSRGAPFLLSRTGAAMAGAAEQGAVAGGTAAGQSLLSGRGIGESAREGIGVGKAFAKGQAGADLLLGSGPSMLKASMKYAPRAFRQMFGIPEPITEHILKKSPNAILTTEKALEGKPYSVLEKMRGALKGQRDTAGAYVNKVEEAIVGTTAGKRMFDAKPIAEAVREELKRPIFMDVVNKYGGAIREKALLEKVAKDMESGLISGEQMMGLRKNLDKMISFKAGPLKQPSKDMQRVVDNINHELRGTLANAYPETLGNAYKEYAEASRLYSRYRKSLGATDRAANDPDIFSDEAAVKKIRFAMERGGYPKAVLAAFDNHVAKGHGLMQQFFDSIVAGEFSASSPRQLSPSSWVMRVAAAMGLMGPQMGASILKTAENVRPGIPGTARRGATSLLQTALQE